MEGNGVTPKSVVVSLISADINHFKQEIIQYIIEFYDEHDSRKSLCFESLLNLICNVHNGLHKILSEDI